MQTHFSLIEVFNALEQAFKGNTSTVVWLEEELEASRLQAIAADFNQPATTFLWKSPNHLPNEFQVRWFAPDAEIGLCGHGSLAAMVYLNTYRSAQDTMVLHFAEGQLEGKKQEEGTYSMTLDGIPVLSEDDIPPKLEEGLGIKVKAYYSTPNKNIVLVENEKVVKNMQPDFAKLRELAAFGYAVTAPGDQVDFVSRTIVPHVQQLEDPATGSSHAALAPYWAEKLGKKKMTAHQLSKRGGKFVCEMMDNKVRLIGQFSILAEGKLKLD